MEKATVQRERKDEKNIHARCLSMNFSVIGNLWIWRKKKFFGILYLICHITFISFHAR